MEEHRGRLIAGGRYRIDEVLAERKSSPAGRIERAVYRVFDRAGRAELVMKAFQTGGMGAVSEKAFDEFGKLAGIDFPSILPVIGCGLDRDEELFYFTTPPVEGRDFVEGLEGRPLDAVLSVLAHILRALDFLHGRGIVHGDLKPSNVLIADDSGSGGGATPWIIDFGLARTITGAGNAPESKEHGGGPSGTLLYMAPEVLEGEGAHISSDLYSLGLMIFQVLFKTLPFDISTPEASIRARLDSELNLPSEIPAGVPASVLNVLEKFLKRNPNQRYISAHEALKDLSDQSGADLDLVTRTTLSGLIKSSTPLLLDHEAGKIEKELGISGEGGKPLVLLSSPEYARLLAERVHFIASVAGVQSSVLIFDGGEESWPDLMAEAEAALSGVFAGTKSAETGLRESDNGFMGLERAVNESGQESLLLLVMNKKPVSDGRISRILQKLVSQASSGKMRIVLFLPDTPGEMAEDLDLAGSGQATLFPAGRLARQEALEFLARLLEWREVSPSLADLLCPAATVDFVDLKQTLIHLVASGVIGFEMGEYRFHEKRLAGISFDGLDQLMGISLESLPDDEKEVVRFLSVFFEGVDEKVIKEMWPERDLRKLVLSLRDRGLVTLFPGRGSDTVALQGFTLRRLVYDSLPPEVKKEHHERAAHIQADDEEAAVHWARSGHVDEAVPRLIRSIETRIATGHLGRAESLADEALRMDKAADYPGMFRVLALKGKVDAYRGRVKDALSLFGRALKEAERHNAGPDEKAELLIERARSFERTGDASKAIACYDEALALNISDKALEARIRSYRAYSVYRMHRFDEALLDLEEALKLMGKTESEDRAATCNRYGTVLFSLGRFVDAEARYRESVRIFESIGKSRYAAGPYYNLGRVLRARGRKNEAVEHMKKAAEFSRENKETYSVCTILTGLSKTYIEMGELTESRRCALDAQAVAEQLGSKRNLAFLCENLGEIALKEGDPDRTEEYADKCDTIWQGLGDERSRSKACLLRAERCTRLALFDEAEKWIGRARDLSGEAPTDPASLEWARIEAEFLLASGRFDEVPAAVESAVGAASEMHAREGEAVLRNLLARALAALGKGQEALREAESALGLLVDVEIPDLKGVVMTTRCAAQRVLGKPDETAAREVISRIQAPGFRDALAEAYLELAKTLRCRFEMEGGIQDLDSARQVLREAENIAESLRYEALLREVKKEEKNLTEITGTAGNGDHELIRRLADMERLQEITRIINSEMDLKKLLDLIVDTALEMTGALRGFIILVKRGQLHFEAARNIAEENINNPEFEVSHSIAKNVALSGNPVSASNAQADDRFRDAVSISELKLQSVLCVPLKAKDDILGSLYIDNHKAINAFDEYDLKVMTVFANQAGIALGNADLLKQNIEKQQDLARSKAEIERLNKELRNTVSNQAEELVTVKGSLEVKQRQLELKYSYDNIVTRSSAMHEVLKVLDRVTPSDFPVIILGESGTGKELVASAIHYNGPRCKADFVSINCAAVVEPLIESELFGYKKGAFTGADKDKAGLFELADKGTLFLDEIGDMSLEVQKRLLRVLQSGEFMRVGGKDVIKVDVRVISATNKDIYRMVKEGSFREDLFYRLNVVIVKLPPLRDRKEDIPLLVDHFQKLHGQGVRSDRKTLETDAVEELLRYDWKGNVRELENMIRNLVHLDAAHQQVSRKDILSLLNIGKESEVTGLSLKEQMEQFEKMRILKELDLYKGNKSKTAKALGMSLRGLYKKLNKYEIR